MTWRYFLYILFRLSPFYSTKQNRRQNTYIFIYATFSGFYIHLTTQLTLTTRLKYEMWRSETKASFQEFCTIPLYTVNGKNVGRPRCCSEDMSVGWFVFFVLRPPLCRCWFGLNLTHEIKVLALLSAPESGRIKCLYTRGQQGSTFKSD